MLHVINVRCVACDLHTIAPMHLSVRVRDGSRHSEKSQIAPLNVIIIIIIIKFRVGLFIGCLTSQQHAIVSQGRICTILRAATLR